MWDYLSTFWDRIVSVGETTIEWFQQIGHAVAGALGQLIEYPIRIFTDGLTLVGYIFSVLIEIFGLAFRPVVYFFSMIASITRSIFIDPAGFEGIGGVGESLGVYWADLVAAAPVLGVLSATTGAIFTIAIGISIIRTIQKV